MKPSEELREQREAILRGTWVQKDPTVVSQACLMVRGTPFRGNAINIEARRALGLALVQLGWRVRWKGLNPIQMVPVVSEVNDHQFTSASDAIEALELAERIAKEAGL